MEDEHVSRQDVEAVLETRRELGPSYDAALVDSFADRIERAVAERVDEQIEMQRRASRRDDSRDSKQLALGIVSLGTGIPITAISASTADLPGPARSDCPPGGLSPAPSRQPPSPPAR